ncbi:hypothetical protein SFUMM280S_07573 [Streptomyces fumanus]
MCSAAPRTAPPAGPWRREAYRTLAEARAAIALATAELPALARHAEGADEIAATLERLVDTTTACAVHLDHTGRLTPEHLERLAELRDRLADRSDRAGVRPSRTCHSPGDAPVPGPRPGPASRVHVLVPRPRRTSRVHVLSRPGPAFWAPTSWSRVPVRAPGADPARGTARPGPPAPRPGVVR